MGDTTRASSDRPLLAGIFLLTLATLVLEIVSARLLSVVTWYHISFFAVSVAMLGMAAGAVSVFAFLGSLDEAGHRRALARFTLAFAIATPLCHLANLALPVPVMDEPGVADFLRAGVAVAFMTLPFYLSGVAVTVALTRLDRPIGTLYAADLIGAAAGCLLVIPLLDATNVTAAAFAAATLGGLAALCFHRFAGLELGGAPLAVCAGLGLAGAVAATGAAGIGLVPGKGVVLLPEEVLFSEWNNHSNAVALQPQRGPAFYWGAGEGADRFEENASQLVIDGGASTWVTEWDGDPQSLEWVRHDVTYLPHALRRGEVAVIGVGGGRDVLSAIAGGSESITGLEVNGILVDWLAGPLREFARIADHPGVRLVHDEARSYLTRSEDRFDVIQMSLIDTWAATGAGAFALTENGLYTLDAWRLLLSRLTPSGVLSVSRWFSPARLSETNRLVVLGVAALLERGVARPKEHLILVSRDHVATLLVSPQPFTATDLARLDAVAAKLGLAVLLAPGREAPSARFAAIVGSANQAELLEAAADPVYDFTPPTDERPYFFNMLRTGATAPPIAEGEVAGVTLGNIRAAGTLRVLVVVSIVLAALIVLAPLARVGLPGMTAAPFAISVGYFAGIGFAYMLLQFALLQRFSVLLGHPTYSLAVVLFAMILFTGVGSLLSDRVRVAGTRAPVVLPLLIAGAVALLSVSLPAVFERTIGLGLLGRVATVVALTAPLSVLLGFCFPFGLRLVTAIAPDAGAWMWGVNGAFSVLGSVSALMISMARGIDGTFALAALTYAALIPLAALLSRANTRSESAPGTT